VTLNGTEEYIYTDHNIYSMSSRSK